MRTVCMFNQINKNNRDKIHTYIYDYSNNTKITNTNFIVMCASAYYCSMSSQIYLYANNVYIFLCSYFWFSVVASNDRAYFFLCSVPYSDTIMSSIFAANNNNNIIFVNLKKIACQNALSECRIYCLSQIFLFCRTNLDRPQIHRSYEIITITKKKQMFSGHSKFEINNILHKTCQKTTHTTTKI